MQAVLEGEIREVIRRHRGVIWCPFCDRSCQEGTNIWCDGCHAQFQDGVSPTVEETTEEMPRRRRAPSE
jgi:ribosomal protein L37AE/L43A